MNHYPFLNPHAAAQTQPTQTFAYEDRTTAQQQFNKIVEEVMSKKNKEKMSQNAAVTDDSKKCKIHPVKPSKTCRECRNVAQTVQTPLAQPSQLDKEKPPEQRTVNDQFELNCQLPLSHINEKLKKNIQGFDYFRELYSLRTFPEVVNEIESQCRSIETFQKGSTEIPTKFMCCFYKLLLMRLVAKQVRGLLEHCNPYVKAAGLLYVRMLCAYDQLYNWLSPYLDIEECTNQSSLAFYPNVDKNEELTIGEYVLRLFKELDHYQLRLPRIPTKIDKEIQHKLATRVHVVSEKPKQELVERMEPEGQLTQEESPNLGIVAIVTLNGKRMSLKVKELAADKVLAWHPDTGHVVQLQYEAVDLQDDKSKLTQIAAKQQINVKLQTPIIKERRRSSRSYSASRRKRRHRRQYKRKDEKHRKRHSHRRGSRSSQNSSKSSSSRSRSRSNRRRRHSESSQSSSKSDRRNKKTEKVPEKPVKRQEIKVRNNPKSDPVAITTHTNIDTLKANIKKLAASASNPQPQTLQSNNTKLLEKYRQRTEEDDKDDEVPVWRDPVLQQEKEEIVRMG